MGSGADAGTNGTIPTDTGGTNGGSIGVPIGGDIVSPCGKALSEGGLGTNFEGKEGFLPVRPLEPAEGGRGGRCSKVALITDGRRPG